MSATLPRRDLAEVLLALGACNDTPHDAVPWARPYGGDWERALAECRHCDWLFWLAARLLSRETGGRDFAVRLACACARSVLHLVPAEEDRTRIAVEATERWVRGDGTEEEARAARSAVDIARAESWSRGETIYYAVRAARDFARAVGAPTLGDCLAFAGDAVSASQKAVDHADDDDPTVLGPAKQHLGPPLLEGLAAYATTISGASR